MNGRLQLTDVQQNSPASFKIEMSNAKPLDSTLGVRDIFF